jgi:photosystem II stability/assembly factor-like uncharacterized protein
MRKAIIILSIIFFISSSGNAQWIVQSPNPTLEILNSVQFTNQYTGYASGSRGLITKTTDGGITWLNLNTNIQPPNSLNSVIFSISFLNPDTGYAVTNNKIIKTTNAGINWFTLDSGSYTNFKYIQFADNNTGYVGGGHSIIKTTNGGINWILQDSSQYYYIFSGYFLNSSTGFFTGNYWVDGMILKTTNGGINWLLYQIEGNTSNTVYFINESVGFIGSTGSIKKTTNGGINWTHLYSTGNPVNYIKFFNSSSGIAIGDNLYAKTTNGGINWVLQNPGNNFKLNYGNFIDTITGYFVGYYGTILKTTNGGNSFINSSSGTFRDLFSIYFLNSNTGFAVGDDGAILKTTNGGSYWKYLNFVTTTTSFQSVFFTGLDNGFICDLGGVISKSTNGGFNWLPVFIAPSGLFDVFFVNNNTGYASGVGCIVKTTNSGINWTVQNPGFPEEFRMVYFLDANTGYSAGKYGNIVKTTNGGVNWLALNSGTSELIHSIHFINYNTGYAAAGNDILKTTNAGYNWSVNFSGAAQSLIEIKFANVLTGYVVTSEEPGYSLIYKTSDGGDNWVSQNPGVNYGLYSLSVINPDTVYAAGWSGTIIKTVNGGGTVGINPGYNEIPSDFFLSQNYPNPFNHSSIINYQCPVSAAVKIVVFDILGRQITEPVNEFKLAGIYSVKFDATDLSSGIYFYKMTAGDFTEVRRMVILK